MNPAFILWRRECRSFLRSPVAWCVFAGFTSATGVLFTTALRQAEGTTEGLPALLCTQLLLLLCIPVSLFTMSLFAAEKTSGTLETLMTAPVTDTEVVLAKFAAAFTLTCMALALACSVFPVYLKLAAPAASFSPLSLYVGLAAVALYAAMWCALGTLLSLLSKHQAPAAIATLVVTAASAVAFIDNLPDFLRIPSIQWIDVPGFARGIADTRIVFAAVSTLVFLLFCAVRILESRRWSTSSK